MIRSIFLTTLGLALSAQATPKATSWNFENPVPRLEQDWQSSTDHVMKGTSHSAVRAEEEAGGNRALHITGETMKGAPLPFSGAYTSFGTRPFEAVDLSAAKTIRFRVKGSTPVIAVALYSEPMGYVPAVQVIKPTQEWKEYRLELASFQGLDAKHVTGLAFSRSIYPGLVDFWVDDIVVE